MKKKTTACQPSAANIRHLPASACHLAQLGAAAAGVTPPHRRLCGLPVLAAMPSPSASCCCHTCPPYAQRSRRPPAAAGVRRRQRQHPPRQLSRLSPRPLHHASIGLPHTRHQPPRSLRHYANAARHCLHRYAHAAVCRPLRCPSTTITLRHATIVPQATSSLMSTIFRHHKAMPHWSFAVQRHPPQLGY